MFEIYGRKNCSWCDAAKALLERKGLSYSYLDIEENERYRDIFKHFWPEAKTVPQILHWKNEPSKFELIGGYTELEQYLNERIS